MTRATAAFVASGHDLVMAALSFVVSLYLRVGDPVFSWPTEFLVQNTLIFTAVAAVVFRGMRLYRGVWRYASLNDLLAITKAVTLTILVFLPFTFFLTRVEGLPRSVLVINWLVLMVFLGAPRFAYRLFKDGHLGLLQGDESFRRVPALVVGSGHGAELFVRAMLHRSTANYRVVGIIDVDPSKVGYQIHGVDVVGSVDRDLNEIVERLERRGDRPQRLIITDDEVDGQHIRSLLEAADSLGLVLSRVPKLTEFKSGAAKDRFEVRPIAIEDLLNRPQTVLDRDGMRELIAEKRVLVTGAGGSIGSELVRQISDFGPARLVLLDNSEYHLYLIDMELSERRPDLPRAAVIADVRDRAKLDRVMADERPDLVFHAAALKHVPMVEANPDEGVLTNVIGTRNVAEACRAAGVTAMVMISTDKAVNPANVMGATKRLAESYCQALDIVESGRPGGGTRYITVRFGNVLGSTGSVVPLFQKQLARGGPLTVTHPDIERYFMTIREAVELVLQAAVLRCEGVEEESGRLFVLDMGAPVRIADLARQMIRLAGLRPEVDVRVQFTGLRPGEKLFEELFHDAEALVPTAVKGIRTAAPRVADQAVLSRAIEALAEVAMARRSDETRVRLRSLVPEYRSSDTPAVLTRRESLGDAG